MHKTRQKFLLVLIILTLDMALGKYNKTKLNKSYFKKHSSLKEEINNERIKRSIADDPGTGIVKRQVDDDPQFNPNTNIEDYNKKVIKSSDKLIKDEPFWGSRGRRDGSAEGFYEYEYPEFLTKHCEHCIQFPIKTNDVKNVEARREDFISQFWANRGRRSSSEIEDISDPFWGTRGRRQEKEPFWGNRGRRTESEPFWGNRGRRDEEPFWGTRGRREDIEPFWGNRGRREDYEPFWGNRGRRDDPFWGTRGRRDDPFWGNRGRRKDSEQTMVENGKNDLKHYILSAINNVELDIENLSRLKKSEKNNGRNYKMSALFRYPSKSQSMLSEHEHPFLGMSTEPGTMLDNRMYVEEPKYILVERASRSSAEEDPYYISRGKKYYFTSSLQQAARDRRGAIEEIVKSVRNDPYNIARGKKDKDLQNDNVREASDKNAKVKELICAAINLIPLKNEGGKVKRDINDNDRDRRTTLKKLAAQLQMDPYFVSRGKKSEGSGGNEYLQTFINTVASKCV